MQIGAKTKHGWVVIIVAFVCKYDKTYAVTIDQNGRLDEYPIEELTVIDTAMSYLRELKAYIEGVKE